MADLASVTGVDLILRESGVDFPLDDFEASYQILATEPHHSELARQIEGVIRQYFLRLRLPSRVTLYDELLLSLREKDVVATFNWDPLLVQAYKRSRVLKRLPRILFLHGNVELGACLEHRQKGFLEHSCPTCDRAFTPQRLLYPVEQKNYEQDPLIANEWREFRDAINKAYLITIFGYAAPKSDVAARQAMLEMWTKNPSRDLAEFEIIDIKRRSDVEATWREFFVRSHFGVTSSLRKSMILKRPRRTCDHFAMATLQLRPCRERPLPRFRRIDRLHEFARQLMAEEEALEQGVPLPCAETRFV